MPKMSNNEVPSIIFTLQASAPSQTAGTDYLGIPSGDVRAYFSSATQGFYRVDSSGVAHRIAFEVDESVGGSAPGAATHYLRISLDGGSTWYRIALSPDS
jgi:hypothetical protein